MGLKHPFLTWFGYITQQKSMVDKWEAQNILTTSIS